MCRFTNLPLPQLLPCFSPSSPISDCLLLHLNTPTLSPSSTTSQCIHLDFAKLIYHRTHRAKNLKTLDFSSSVKMGSRRSSDLAMGPIQTFHEGNYGGGWCLGFAEDIEGFRWQWHRTRSGWICGWAWSRVGSFELDAIRRGTCCKGGGRARGWG